MPSGKVNEKSHDDFSERLVGAALHVCEIFDAFSVEKPSLTLTEIATCIGLRKSSTLLLLRSLLRKKYVAVNTEDRRYRLGERMGHCASVYTRSITVTSIARPLLERLTAKTNETASLQARNGEAREVLVQIQSPESVRVVIEEHKHYGLDVGAAGLVLRAFREDWMAQSDHARLAKIRAEGQAVIRGELIPGAIALYVPVLEPNATTTALTIGVQAPEFRISASTVRAILSTLQAAARELAEVIPPGAPLR